MDTSNILFIVGGTFVGIEEIIRKRLGHKTLGFGGGDNVRNEQTTSELLAQVQTEDILQFGLIPELVGRLPVVSYLQPLDEEGLVQVMTEPKNALVKQYQALFQMEKCELRFTEEALHFVARRALEKGVGARGLRGILEEVMLDIMYDLPDQEDGTVFTIDESIVSGSRKLFQMPTTKSA
jgi:ATP-dependent Clp protease ATP-binding subunit ClpX